MISHTITPTPPNLPHTLTEFEPAKLELGGYHPSDRRLVGFWKPTPTFAEYLRKAKETETDPKYKARSHERFENAMALPWPRENSCDLSDSERRQLIAYLDWEIHKQVSFRGWSACRLCEKYDNGDSDVDDGTYVWPSGLTHYVEAHRVGLPAEFVSHCLLGGKPPVISTMQGWVVVERYQRLDSYFDLPGRIFPTPEAVIAHLVSVYASCRSGAAPWAYDAAAVSATLVNGRISEIRETGQRVPALEAVR